MCLRVAALLLVASVLWLHASANSDVAIDCCLKTTNRKIPLRVIQSYVVQRVSGGCQIPATVFVTRSNMKLCAPPASGNNWVAKLIKKLNPENKKRGKSKPRKNGKKDKKNHGR